MKVFKSSTHSYPFLTKIWISQSVFHQFLAVFEGVIRGYQRPVFFWSLIFKYERPKLQSGLFPVFFQSWDRTSMPTRRTTTAAPATAWYKQQCAVFLMTYTVSLVLTQTRGYLIPLLTCWRPLAHQTTITNQYHHHHHHCHLAPHRHCPLLIKKPARRQPETWQNTSSSRQTWRHEMAVKHSRTGTGSWVFKIHIVGGYKSLSRQ